MRFFATWREYRTGFDALCVRRPSPFRVGPWSQNSMKPFRTVHRLLSCAAVLMVAAAPLACTSPYRGRTQAAGVVHLGLESPSLSTPVDVQIWYPAAAKILERPMFYTSAYWGFAAPNVPARPKGHYPLVLLAHGWRGTRFDLSWIAEDLARKGYVVASLDAPDADAKTFQNAQAPKIWFRAALLKQLIDAMAKVSPVAAITDTTQVAVIGHSAGGSAAMVIAGAQIDPERFAQNFPESAPVVQGDFSDARVKAIVGLNPGTGPVFTPKGLETVRVPTLIISGTEDCVAPEATNAGLYASSIAHAQWQHIVGANHYTFMPVCSVWGQLRGFSTCSENHPELDRATVHAQTLKSIEAFLAQSLQKPKCPAVG